MKKLDETWLYQQVANEDSKLLIRQILDYRTTVLKKNQFISDDSFIQVNFKTHNILLRKSSSFSSIEIYHEIFREDNHFLHSEFSGYNELMVIDIGANEGYYSIKIKERSPACKVICVEPNRYALEVLLANFRINGIQNFECVNKALSADKGTLNMQIVKQIPAIAGRDVRISKRPWLSDSFIEVHHVETTTLDDLFMFFDIQDAGIVKIDVEGMELEVLKGGRKCLRNVKKIVVECHSKLLKASVIDFLESENFKLVYDENPDDIRYYGDLYFINKTY